MRVFVTGASGFVGRCFVEIFRDEIVAGSCFSRNGGGLLKVDLRDRGSVTKALAEFQPDVVIHCAARPTVDWCEYNPEEAHRLNVAATETLASFCGDTGAKLVFLSTDYVFDGLNGPYSEEDQTNPINVYGKHKLLAEQAIEEHLKNCLIIRTTNVYGFDMQSKNFLMGILPRLAKGERVSVAADQFGTPTLVDDLCSTVKQIISTGESGAFHVVGPDLMNRVDWAQAAAKAFGLNPELVEAKTTEELGQPAPRPKRCGLISNRLTSLGVTRLSSVQEGLLSMKQRWGGAPDIALW